MTPGKSPQTTPRSSQDLAREDARRKAQSVLDTHLSYPGRLTVEWNKEWLDRFARDVLYALSRDGNDV